jgi:hypothetical protein
MTDNNQAFYKALAYRERTGLCIICREKPAVRMTCSHIACMERWCGMKTVGSNKAAIKVEFEARELQWALAVAKERESSKRGTTARDKRYRSESDNAPKHDDIETHRIGILGELAAAKVLRGKMNTDFGVTGKDMPDLVIGGIKIEVKTLQGYLAFREDGDFRRGIAILVTHQKGENITVQGWIDAPAFHEKKFYADFGYGKRPCVHPQDMRPIMTLREQLEIGVLVR